MKWICQICHIVRSVRESDLWSVRPCGRPWESEVRGRVGGRSASHAHRASRTSAGRSNAFSRGSDCIARCAWESDRPPTRPLTSDSHGLPQGLSNLWVMWSVWESEVRGRAQPPTASQIWESDRPLTHTGRESDPRGYLTDFTAKRIASPARVRSDSHGLTDRPHRFESPINLSRTPAEAMRLAVKSVR